MKQKQKDGIENRVVIAKGDVARRDGGGRLGLADVSFIYKHQGPSVQHRELYPVFHDNP